MYDNSTIKKEDDLMFQDFKFIFKKPLLIATLFFVSLFPVIYSLTFLGAMWNPYDRTGDMAFHIVNEDEGTEDINIGSNIEEELSDNDRFDWKFTGLDEAKEAVQSGDAYGYLVIPSDASDNAASLLSEQPEKVNLTLHTNPGYNFIGSIMAQQAGSELEKNIQTEITSTYTSSLIDEIAQVSDRSGEAEQAINELTEGAVALDQGLLQLQGSTAELQEGSNTLYSGEQQFSSQLNQASALLGNYAQPITGAQSQLESGAGDLNNGIGQLNSGVSELKAGSEQLSGGLQEVQSQFQELQNRMDESGLVFTSEGADAITHPIELTTETSVETDNYAQGFAPLVVAVSLFIGAITFNVVYPINKIFDKEASVVSRWISRGLLFISHSVLISSLLYATIVWIMQIDIYSHWRFYFAMIMWSLVSIIIIATMVTIFGNFGKFLGIVLLIVQLSSSGGTFPIETANNFYQSLFDVLPMAFIVSGFKDAIFNQAFNVEFSTVIIYLAVISIVLYLMILLVLWLKDKFPAYEEKINKMSRFEG